MFEQKLNILAIDDDSADAELLRRRLAALPELDFDFHHHNDPSSAVEQVRQQTPDVVFIDFHMGAMTGLDVLYDIRLSQLAMSVIMLTGQGNEAMATKCLRSGADDYVSKSSLDGDMLRRALQHALAQQARRNAETELRLIQFSIDYASDPVFWTNRDGRFVYANEMACQSLGYERHELLELAVPDIVPDLTNEAYSGLWRELEHSGSKTHEVTHRRRDGSTFPVEVNLNYVQFRDTNRLCAFARDISQRKRAEDELREKEEQLRHKQRLEAIGSLAGGVAHEFNNLLQVIQGYTKFAMEQLPAEGQVCDDLQIALDAAQRAASITGELLNFSRRQTPERTCQDLNELVRAQADMLRPLLGEQFGLVLTLDDSATALIDRGMIQQSLMNLLLNAKDAMPCGGEIHVTTRLVCIGDRPTDFQVRPSDDRGDTQLDEVIGAGVSGPQPSTLNPRLPCPAEPLVGSLGLSPGPYVQIAVRDTGEGMSEKIQERIFDPFFTTKAVGEGTGMGMPFVYGVVQQHEGAIHVTSRPGNGTTIEMYLPYLEENAMIEEQQVSAAADQVREAILIAEDEPLVRDIAIRTLRRTGYEILIAENGLKAVEVFRENTDRIVLVLLDVIMPKLGGHDAYTQMKAIKPDVKALFCSGYDPETANSDLLVEQRLQLMQKPYDPAQLLQAVQDSLNASCASEVPCTSGCPA